MTFGRGLLWAQAKARRAVCRYRHAKMNLQKNIQISPPEYIGHSVRVTTDSDGWHLGGAVDIGPSSRLSDYSTIDAYGGRVTIGQEFYLGRYSLLQGYGDITIGDHVMIGPNTSIVASSHTFDDLHTPMRHQDVAALQVVIADDVWIGAGVRILGGVTIRRGAIIGAGSVVIGDVCEHEIRAGVPARLISLRR